ncbi:MAG TPA: DUF4394 domain-containing protein [Actinophytocola sp.]|uniref:DUF4394 domain-containing protein n=1 Tax=Actinophytocola sp. TaxID=1872138 RepID=UPI002DBA9727|nr:DUF4394 domain-containing protein [Actinophytocola sp.]HEU5474331.1 DUF4394 domain-containing protein [Actinophytocola sp.]
MRKTITTIAVAALAAATLGAGTATAAPRPALSGQLLVLTDDGVLSRHDVRRPVLPRARVKVVGLAAGERLIGLDTRPANGIVYALSSAGQLYTVDHRTGRVTPVGARIALSGRAVGFDFNPTVDRIRVVTATGQNLRLNPDNGAVAGTDTNLAYAATDVAAGRSPRVVGSGYTNSVTGATSTALYGIDSARDVLVLQGSVPGAATPVSPNTGQLFSVGGLGLRVRDALAFDITGAAPAGPFNPADYRAVAAVAPEFYGWAFLVEIDLATGKARPFAPLFGRPVGLTFLN